MVNQFIPQKPQPLKTVELRKSAGILDDYAVRKNVATKEGTVEKVPVNDSDIANKKYVDDVITLSLHLDQTTAQTVINGTPKIENGLLIGTDANFTDYPKAKFVSSQSDTGHTYASNLGIVGEAASGNVLKGVGVGGVALLNGSKDAFGTFGRVKIGNTAYTGDAIGLKGASEETHAGGKNIAVYGVATGGASNYSFYGESGTLFNSGYVGIGTTAPESALDIINSTIIGQLRLATNKTDSTVKFGGLTTGHYLNAEEPVLMMMGSSGATENYINFGGGSSTANTCNIIRFYTAANNTTVTGTERMRIQPTGRVGIGTTAPSTKLHIIDTAEQLRLGYDTSNYKSETISSTGTCTTGLTGTSPINDFSQAVKFSGGTQSSDGSAGITATIVTAQLTALGSQGSMTFKNGILTAQIAAT